MESKTLRVHSFQVASSLDEDSATTCVRAVAFRDGGVGLVDLQLEDNSTLIYDPIPHPLDPVDYDCHTFTPAEARQLAQALLLAADDAEKL